MPGSGRAFSLDASAVSIQREAGRKTTHVRWRAERLAVDRAIVVLARERWVSEGGWKRVIGELAVTRQNLGAAIEPGALGDVDAGMRSLLIRDVGAVLLVIGARGL